MTPDVFGDRKLYAFLLAGAFLAFVLLKLLGCGGVGPTRTMAKIVRSEVEAQCSDMMTVVECLDAIDKNAAAVDRLIERAIDGGK